MTSSTPETDFVYSDNLTAGARK